MSALETSMNYMIAFSIIMLIMMIVAQVIDNIMNGDR